MNEMNKNYRRNGMYIHLVQTLRAPEMVSTFEIPAELSKKLIPGYETIAEERSLINAIFILEYMGAAEYEFGSFGKALREVNALALDGKMEKFTASYSGLPYKFILKVPPMKELKARAKSVTIYGFCQTGDSELVKKFIDGNLKDRYSRNNEGDPRWSLKCSINLAAAFFGEWKKKYGSEKIEIDYSSKEVAWLDIDNGWLITTDKAYFDKVSELLNIK